VNASIGFFLASNRAEKLCGEVGHGVNVSFIIASFHPAIHAVDLSESMEYGQRGTQCRMYAAAPSRSIRLMDNCCLTQSSVKSVERTLFVNSLSIDNLVPPKLLLSTLVLMPFRPTNTLSMLSHTLKTV